MKVLHLGRPGWVGGEVLSTGDWARSDYWLQRWKGSFRKPLPSGFVDGVQQAAPVLGAVITPLFSLVEQGATAAELLKEYVFEDVRQAAFSERPSRWRGIFALPPGGTERDALAVLGGMGLLGAGRPLVELELLEGRTHSGASEWLNCNSKPPADIEANARAYWNAQGQIDEVLYEGTFVVSRVVQESV